MTYNIVICCIWNNLMWWRYKKRQNCPALNFLSTKQWKHMGEWMYISSASWRWLVSLTPLRLYPWGKSPRFLSDKRLGGPQSQSARYGEVKILDPTGTQTPTPRSASLLNVWFHGAWTALQQYIYICKRWILRPMRCAKWQGTHLENMWTLSEHTFSPFSVSYISAAREHRNELTSVGHCFGT
jgi:hypothetical protein